MKTKAEIVKAVETETYIIESYIDTALNDLRRYKSYNDDFLLINAVQVKIDTLKDIKARLAEAIA